MNRGLLCDRGRGPRVVARGFAARRAERRCARERQHDCTRTSTIAAPALAAQNPAPSAAASSRPAAAPADPDYIIGPDDVLSVVFWRDRDLSSDVVVRPDGKISLPLLNEIHAAGLTPEQLRQVVMAAANEFIEEPNPSVLVKQINSRRVFITGQVEKPGPHPLTGPMTVVQLIALSGGLKEFADAEHIVIMRTEGSRTVSYRCNYVELTKRRNLPQNIALRPGDTVIVP